MLHYGPSSESPLGIGEKLLPIRNSKEAEGTRKDVNSQQNSSDSSTASNDTGGYQRLKSTSAKRNTEGGSSCRRQSCEPKGLAQSLAKFRIKGLALS